MPIWPLNWPEGKQAVGDKGCRSLTLSISNHMDIKEKSALRLDEIETMQSQDVAQNNGQDCLARDVQYLRIGTNYYKRSNVPQASGGVEERLLLWSRENIRDDSPDKHFIESIPKYDGFCVMPSHTDYKEVIGGWVNQYKPIPFQPAEGDFTKTMKFLIHIFGEQVELGLDYLQLLYLEPIRKLPALVLVSKERCTGKTTFLNFLHLLFGENVTFNTNEEFRNQFNSSWANKLIICIDEAFLNKAEDAQQIKSLSTSKQIKIEAKGKDKVLIDFFGKFVMASNNENNPVYIEPGEVRYWVRKIPVLGHDNINLLQELKQEVPAFLYFLQHRALTTKEESRMWFNPKLLCTDAFTKIVHYNESPLEKELKAILIDIMEHEKVERVDFSVRSMFELMRNSGYSKIDKGQVRQIVSSVWGLRTGTPRSFRAYTFFEANTGHYASEVSKEERFYTITKDFLNGR